MDLQLTAPATMDTLNKFNIGNICSLVSLSHYSSLNITNSALWSPSVSFRTTESFLLSALFIHPSLRASSL